MNTNNKNKEDQIQVAIIKNGIYNHVGEIY